MQSDPLGFGERMAKMDLMYSKLMKGLELLERISQTHFKGKAGAPGLPGRSVTQAEVDAAVQKMLRQPKDGVSPTLDDVLLRLLGSSKFWKKIGTMTKKGEDGKDADAKSVAEAVLATLEAQGISPSKIAARIAEVRNHSAMYGGGKDVRGGGDTVTAGSGVTITTNVNGVKVITASGGAGAWLTPVETPNGIITVFTVASQPTDVVADGVQLFDGAGYTYAALQITFVNPPAQFVRYR